MALPRMNDIPKYTMVIPSTGRKVVYRPFLVKEQKVLLIALESQDEDQILRAIVDSIVSCVDEQIDVSKLATFDIEYMFIRIRMKSAGETSEIGVPCQSCGEYNEYTVNLEDIQINLPEKQKQVKLNDQYTIQLKYPNYQALLEENQNAETEVEKLYHLILACLDCLLTEEERISFDDEPKEEIEKFLEQLTTTQFDEIVEFVQDLPRLQHEIEFKCEYCETEQKRLLQGFQDFFQSPSLTTT